MLSLCSAERRASSTRTRGVRCRGTPQGGVSMTIARVVSFEGVNAGNMEEQRKRIESEGRPDDLPASELMILHDPEAEKALAIVFFDSEDDYARGDAALNAMPAADTPGRRVSVSKYEVAMRMNG